MAETIPFPTSSPPDGRLLGEVITWTCNGLSIAHLALVEALAESGLDAGVARELAPRHAFSRACKRLSERRIIRPVAENATTITFQFTAESRADDHYEYVMETLLTLHKQTGTVTCDLPGLATLAQEELDRCIAVRTGSDVTRIVQKLFEKQADLFAIRPTGGAYFVPAAHAAFVGRVEGFLRRVNGRLLRFPVPAGVPTGEQSVRRAVADGLATVVAEHRRAVAAFDADTRGDTLERAAEHIRTTRFKVETYAAYLAEERVNLDRELAAAAAELRAKVEQIASREHAAPSP